MEIKIGSDAPVARASSSTVVNLGLIPSPAWRQALKGQCGGQAGKFTCWERRLAGFPNLKRARYIAP